jgi:hypothetical protein
VVSLFASLEPETDGQAIGFADTRVPIPDTEFDKSQRLAFEKEMLGLLRRLTDTSIAELVEQGQGRRPP